MWELWMGFNKTMVINAWHRLNMARCSTDMSRQNFANLRRVAASGPGGEYPDGPPNIISASTIYDQEYIRHYTGTNPIYLGANLFDALPNGGYIGSEPSVLLNCKCNANSFA